ncbi:MAG: hypothetical protein ACOC8Y_05875 [Candidatus Natronoplasma sp.]
MQDLKTEKLFEAFITKLESETDRNTRNCPILRAQVKLLTKLKSENSRRLLDDLGFVVDLDTSSCKSCES